MAEYSITATNVDPQGKKGSVAYLAGEAMAAGDWFYVLEADGKAYKAKADSQAHANVVGQCMNSPVAIGQPVVHLSDQEIIHGSIYTGAGKVLVISHTTAGKAMDAGDLSSGDWIAYLGTSTAATKMKQAINATGIQKA